MDNNRIIFNSIFCIMAFTFCLWTTGCKTEPVIIDTGNIERIRQEYNDLRTEYERLQSDYNELTANSKFYADYYQHATESIGIGLDELDRIGTDNAGEIEKLREYVTILRGIILSIIEGESGKSDKNIEIDGTE